MPRGKFIVFEGIDGSGLTTQAELLRNWFLKQGLECYLTKEPSEGPAGVMIRLALSKRLTSFHKTGQHVPLDNLALALFFAADRIDHLSTAIMPRLEMGVNVISDRYYLSSFAFQAIQADLHWIRSINSKCEKPDLTIFLDVPAEICKKRMERQRWHVELYEETDRLEEVHLNYLAAIKQLSLENENIEVINGVDSIQNVHKAVSLVVKRTLSKRVVPNDRCQLGLELEI